MSCLRLAFPLEQHVFQWDYSGALFATYRVPLLLPEGYALRHLPRDLLKVGMEFISPINAFLFGQRFSFQESTQVFSEPFVSMADSTFCFRIDAELRRVK